MVELRKLLTSDGCPPAKNIFDPAWVPDVRILATDNGPETLYALIEFAFKKKKRTKDSTKTEIFLIL